MRSHTLLQGFHMYSGYSDTEDEYLPYSLVSLGLVQGVSVEASNSGLAHLSVVLHFILTAPWLPLLNVSHHGAQVTLLLPSQAGSHAYEKTFSTREFVLPRIPPHRKHTGHLCSLTHDFFGTPHLLYHSA